ncbi:hypothetical protein Ahy_A02g008959 [Arachis hypogaea]|uniref:Replication protein A 70 kDa DNA-binding subunit B/D first OB fold domain-containing protein n=1 Tax=Arachis hypogaea TaxID=3818 RepID=A0A445EG64_ARAHY|nr:hypothetical protein Ahy_A02g008959 [Arachis hypogaea]
MLLCDWFRGINIGWPSNYLPDINPTKLAWNLVVGVVRLYELCSQSNTADVYSLEMVLQDEQGDRIHCSIPKANIVVFKTLIRENGIHSMKNFIVQGNNKLVKTTGHKYKLSFYMKTCVSLLSMGKEDAQAMVIKFGQQSKYIELYLKDLEQNRMKCTLFGKSMDKVISFMDKPETLAKPTGVEFVSHSAIIVEMDSPDVHGSSNKTTRCGVNPEAAVQ